MSDANDMDLLRDYSRHGSEEAFAELVQRHIGLVYSVALRQIGIAAHAEEITQAVFIIPARKASSLGENTILEGWLYETTRLTALSFLRGERRRQFREQEAYMQSTLQKSADNLLWNQLAPLLDEAMSRLGKKDRDAVILRFFKDKSVREVAAILQVNEAAAQRRTLRALEKLRKFFTKRGVSSTTAILAGTISANSVQAAPVALAKSVTAVAIAKGAAASGSTLTLIKGALKIMAWTKAKTAIVVGAVAILAIGTSTVVVKKIASSSTEYFFAHFDSVDLDKSPPVFILRPSKYANQGDYIISGSDLGPEGRVMRRGSTFGEILSIAYGFGPEQMILPKNLPQEKFDLLLTLPNNSREVLRKEIKKQFGITAHPETRDTDVLVLKNTNPNAPGLKISSGGGPNIWVHPESLKLVGYKMSDPSGYDVVHVLGSVFYNLPIIDETGLTNTYDIDAHWNGNLHGNAGRKKFDDVMSAQLGLELVPDRRPIEMLVVEKAQ